MSVAQGFSTKAWMPASTAALKWVGSESRRRRQQDHVDARVDHLLVGIDPVENAAVEALGEFVLRDRRLAHHLQLLLGLDAVKVAHRVELHVVIGGEGVQHRATAPSAGADDTDLEFLVVRRAEGHGGESDRGGGRGGGSRGFDEGTSRRFGRGGDGGFFAHEKVRGSCEAGTKPHDPPPVKSPSLRDPPPVECSRDRRVRRDRQWITGSQSRSCSRST
jgi:hypothetical protein